MERNGLVPELERGLLLIDFLALTLLLTIIFLPGLKVVRILLGIPFLLLFPGYAAVSALYPEKDLEGAERLIYGLGLSLAIVVPLGLFLNWTPYGLNLTTSLVALFSLMMLFTAISWLRRGKIPPGRRFEVALSLSDFREWYKEERKMAAGCVATLFLVIALGSLLVTHQYGNEFTEFYLIEGENLERGQNSSTLGIVNHEGLAQTYSVEAVLDNREIGSVEGIELKPGDSWMGDIGFRIGEDVGNGTVEFVLYMNSERTEKELRLHIGGN